MNPRRFTSTLVVVTALLSACGTGAGPAAVDEVAPRAAPTIPGAAATWQVGDEAAWRTLASFAGPRWDDTADADAVVVLDDTVTTFDDGGWSAAGLVRNESAASRSVEVVAELLGADGAVLARPITASPVTPVRSGEPAPFLLRSVVPHDDVAAVRWEVRSAPLAGDRGTVELVQWWQRPAGLAQPIDTYLRHEAPDGPFPYAMLGGAVDHGSGTTGLDVVAAWLDDEGRVLWVASVPLAAPRSTRSAATVEPTTAEPAVDERAPSTAPGSTTDASTATTTTPTSITVVGDSGGGHSAPTTAPVTTSVEIPTTTVHTTTTATPSSSSTTMTTTTMTASPAPPPAHALAAGGQADFLLVVDHPVAARFSGMVMLWAVPR